jgi:uncharacterized membrane protein YhaH (DUF805 family)
MSYVDEQYIISMDTHELIERLGNGLLVEEAKHIIKRELRNRGINPDDPVVDDDVLVEPVSDFSISDLPLWRQLFTFRGRASRLKFWIVFVPCLIVFNFLIWYLEILLNRDESVAIIFVILAPVAWVFWATMAQRCHDRNKSGRYTALLFIPLIGLLWAIVELGCLPGSKDSNRFGRSTR